MAKVRNLFDPFLERQRERQIGSTRDFWQGAHGHAAGRDQLNAESIVLPYDPAQRSSVRAWIGETLKQHLEFLQQTQPCAYCRELYNSWENIGTLHCSYHPGFFVDGAFTCCRGSSARLGCRRCDHSSQMQQGGARWDDHTALMKVPSALIGEFKTPQHSLLPALACNNSLDPARSYVVVLRIEMRDSEKSRLVQRKLTQPQ